MERKCQFCGEFLSGPDDRGLYHCTNKSECGLVYCGPNPGIPVTEDSLQESLKKLTEGLKGMFEPPKPL